MTLDQLIQMINHSDIHKNLYHFTDESNFDTIGQRGLLSKAQMREEGWWPSKTGGNGWSHDQDLERGVDPYVSLCFTTKHPMKYLAHKDDRLPNPRYLVISPEVLRIEGVKIAFGVANANNTQILPILQALERLDVEVIYARTDWTNSAIQARLKAAERMEVLVPHGVSRELILGYR